MSSIDKISTGPVTGVQKPNDAARSGAKPDAEKSGAVPFSELLGQSLQKPAAPAQTQARPDLKFSAHAQTRMHSRGIELSPQEMMRIKEAVGKASDKGSRESLILTDKAAFVVSVKNGTVITAMDKDQLKENVFTNIDSTVVI